MIPGVEVRIAPDGEILVRGPNVFKGYWERPEATAAVLEDGWYHTGDHGILDEEGFLTLQGRKKDMLVMPDGTKVHPDDIEQVLTRDPRVRDATVVGLERAEGDVQVHAVLILRDDDEADEVVRRGEPPARRPPADPRLDRVAGRRVPAQLLDEGAEARGAELDPGKAARGDALIGIGHGSGRRRRDRAPRAPDRGRAGRC